jgi:surfeit locus 1 family protein
VLRTALKPRWLALLALAALVIVAFVQLGRWQLGVAEDAATRDALEQARKQGVVELSTVLKPHEHFPNALSARQVRATGTYAASGQVLVANRRLDGVSGYWVITPLRVAETNATLPVLRGFLTDPAAVTAPPTRTVTVTGGLAPGESPYTGPPLPAGQLGSVDISILVNEWPGDLYNAFLFREAEAPGPSASGAAGASGTPAAASELNTLTKVPTPIGAHGFKWRNAAYALQWWVFAAFAAFMWWRMVRDDNESDQAQEAAGAPDRAPREGE